MSYVDINSQDQFSKDVLQSSTPVIIDFWADWCGPCKMVAPVFDELSNQYTGKVAFARVDVDALPELAAKYGVQSIPTMLFVKSGNEVGRMIGAHPKQDYVQELDKLA